jgi:hypothetical protein
LCRVPSVNFRLVNCFGDSCAGSDNYRISREILYRRAKILSLRNIAPGDRRYVGPLSQISLEKPDDEPECE